MPQTHTPQNLLTLTSKWTEVSYHILEGGRATPTLRGQQPLAPKVQSSLSHPKVIQQAAATEAPSPQLPRPQPLLFFWQKASGLP